MQKIFVLDTSVLVYDAKSLSSFGKNQVVISVTVLEELDKIKKFPDEAGKNARVVIRELDAISNSGDVSSGVKLENGTTLKMDVSIYDTAGMDPTYGDNKILVCASNIQKNHPKDKVILVSKDINLRIKAKAFGLVAQDYEKDKIPSNELYTGFKIVESTAAGETLKEAGRISMKYYSELGDFLPNECISFVDKKGKGISIGRVVKDQLILLSDCKPWNLELRNREQLLAANLILDQNIPLVSLIGKSGCGKTLVSLACSLELVLNKRFYDSLVIYRPIQPMGNDLGYLPGTADEKLSPWFSAIDDSFAFLFSDKSRKKDGWKAQLHQYLTNGTIEKQALTYIRGRSIPNSLILIDEAQNLSRAEIKTVLTRCGMGSKVILTGDIYQIDAPYLDATDNGLSYVIEKFKTSELAGHITFSKGERSQLATLASEIM